MIRPVYDPMKGRMRVAALASGSGNTLWKVHDLQLELEKTFEGSTFEVVALFSDNPGSKAIEIAEERGIPVTSIDIRQFYADREKPLKDRDVRAEFDNRIMDFFELYDPDVILLAGYVWATTSAITGSLPVINVHPADLSVKDSNGNRAYAGANGVGAALADNAQEVRSSAHLATDELDGGPIILVSPPVPVDQDSGMEEKERFRKYLKLVNEQSRYAGARTILEISLGNFGRDEKSILHYKGDPVPDGLKLESWSSFKPLHERDTEKLLNPRSIAVIGASAKPGLGNAVLRNIVDYEFNGSVFAVNRKGEDVLGVRGYRSVKEIEETVDLALVTVPASFAVDVIRECGEKGVKAVATLTAGFREMGEEGARAESEIMEIINRYNMRLLGPNCMGLLNTDPQVRLHSNMLQNIPARGPIGLITQSGAIGAAMLDWAEELGLGFSMITSTGNQPDLNICDLLPLYAMDSGTKVILAYLEMIPEPARFARVLSMVNKIKPVIILKSGRTEAGAAAARSHTGSLAGNEQIAEALIQKTGALRVNTLEEAFLLASALGRMPKIRGSRVGIISNAGGPGTLVADALNDLGFVLPVLSHELRDSLAKDILPQASTANPLDLVATAAPEHYGKASRLMAESGIYDALIVIMVPPVTVETGSVAQAMIDSLKDIDIPVLTCFFGPKMGRAGRNVMLEGKIPSFPFPEQTAQVLNLMRETETPDKDAADYPSAVPARELQNIRSLFKGTDGTFLPPEKCQTLLMSYGFKVARSILVLSPQEVDGLDLNFPVVAKIDHSDIIHKSDSGGVILDIADKGSLKKVVSEMFSKFPGARGVLVQEQVRGNVEVILGAKSDPALGHVVLAGYGGVGVEVFKDVSWGHVPFGRVSARKMLKDLKCYRILEGYRGKPGVDLENLEDLIMKMQGLLITNPEIEEMDLNPLIFDGKEFIVADYRIKIAS